MYQVRAERRELDPGQVPRLPALDASWLRRWRRRFGVSYRSVNLRYKISKAKRAARIRVFWSNCMGLCILREHLFGPGKLRFIGFDQKPMWLNAAHAPQTLALTGQSGSR